MTNTTAWTDDSRFLTADTLGNEIYAFNYDHKVIFDRSVFDPAFRRGRPDGSYMDEEGYL